MRKSQPEVVVVTGASAGAGRAVAREFGNRRARVPLLARGRDGLEAASWPARPSSLPMFPPRATILWVVIAPLIATSGGASVPPPGSTVPVFSIAKSQNKNRVQYVIRVDEHCVPIAPAQCCVGNRGGGRTAGGRGRLHGAGSG